MEDENWVETMTVSSRGGEIETLVLYVNGQWKPSASRADFGSIGPFTGSTLSHVTSAAAEDVNKAVRKLAQ